MNSLTTLIIIVALLCSNWFITFVHLSSLHNCRMAPGGKHFQYYVLCIYTIMSFVYFGNHQSRVQSFCLQEHKAYSLICARLMIPNKVETEMLIFVDVLMYKRKVERGPSPRANFVFVNYPEHADMMGKTKVISCIACRDLHELARPLDSDCRVVLGGVDKTSVRLKLFSRPGRGLNYDIAIYGHRVREQHGILI